nr:terpene synthase HlTPS3 [Humulus lupulus]
METQRKSHELIFDHESHHDQRRSANYTPTIWKYDFLESLNNKYDSEEYKMQAEKLIEDVRYNIVETKDLKTKLELINTIRKLGLTYHFEDQIKKALDTISSSSNIDIKYPLLGEDLYLTSLYFRLLRLHGYQVSQDMFIGYKAVDCRKGRHKITSAEVKVMIELSEASDVAFECENTLIEAKVCAEENLKFTFSNIDGISCNNNKYLPKHVAHALELPPHWRVQWFDVKWQIEAHEHGGENNINTDSSTTSLLVDLAKLNFNMVQATLQKDIRELSSWWKNLGLSEKLDFARDRLVESFMCTVGLAFQPEYKCLRKCLAKVVNFVLIVDDVYDVYGSLEELRHFTNAVDRWDVRETQKLPECMKICFQALYDTTCEIAEEIENENGCKLVLLPHLKKAWADFCKSLLVEAEWYHKGYIPSFEEYLRNGWISSSGPLLLVLSYFAIPNETNNTASSYLDITNQDLVYNISLIIRLCNDLGTSAAEQERGDAASSILCYRQETKSSEEDARKHIREMIRKTWQKINKICYSSSSRSPLLSLSFIDIALNAARVAHSLYQSGDAFSAQHTNYKTHILSLLVHPLVPST